MNIVPLLVGSLILLVEVNLWEIKVNFNLEFLIMVVELLNPKDFLPRGHLDLEVLILRQKV